jgi:single-strand DNA-binding protein
MARGINKVILVGNLGGDPEIRYSGGGSAIASFSVATSESWTDKQTGQKQERTEWHSLTAFGKTAEIIGEYAKKGRQVYIEGRLKTDKYTGKDGVERYSTKVIVEVFQLLGGAGGEGGERSQGNAPAQQPRSAPPPDDYGTRGFDDDDIPFRQHEYRTII